MPSAFRSCMACVAAVFFPLTIQASIAAPGLHTTDDSAETPSDDGDGDGERDDADASAELTAAEQLERGFAAIRATDSAAAAKAFSGAVGTGKLNDAGRAVAYWHIHIAEESLAHPDASAEALASFLAVAQDIIGERRERRYAADDSGDFVDHFSLVERVTRARAALSAIWADKAPGFGRSASRPVPIESPEEIPYFIELAPPCGHAPERQVLRESVGSGTQSTTERVTVRCPEAKEGVEYYFER